MGSIRYINTGRWEEDWFVALPMEYKLLYEFLIAHSNHAGIWKVSNVNKGRAEVLISHPFDWDNAIDVFNKDAFVVSVTNSGDWFLIDHLHQTNRGGVRPNNNATKSIVSILKSEGVWEEYCDIAGIEKDVKEPERKPDEEKPKAEPKITKKVIDEMFQGFWSEYPSLGKRSNPKKTAYDKFSTLLKGTSKPDELFERIIKGLKINKTKWGEPEFIPQAQRWLKENRWEDMLDQNSPQSSIYKLRTREA